MRAADLSAQEALVYLDQARTLIAESADLYEAGLNDEAYTAARNAYLDNFEFVEISLRVRDDALTLELEEDFARLRGAMQQGEPASEVTAIAAEVLNGLDRVERTLSEPGLAAPFIAAVSAFTILFREGLEATLVVAAVLGYLEASRNQQYRGAVLRGVLGALIATAVIFVIVSTLVRLAPVQREIIEAGTALIASGVLFYVSFWLVSKIDQRRWMEFVKAKVFAAAATGSAVALFFVGFTSVFREGLETVLFYQALLAFGEGLELWIALGTAVAVAVLAVLAYVILVAGRRVPVKRFLQVAVILIMALSVAFIGNAVRALQEIELVPISFIESAPRLPIFLTDLLGWHPTVQTIAAQLILAAIYVVGGLYVAVIGPRRGAKHANGARPGPAPAT
ncbi:MAG TPA: FTR1 family protein [Candidatus Limnocylindrales bacterium]|nr:FTR1 family protein [Candidatus Limnocylindrales bacterium]